MWLLKPHPGIEGNESVGRAIEGKRVLIDRLNTTLLRNKAGKDKKRDVRCYEVATYHPRSYSYASGSC